MKKLLPITAYLTEFAVIAGLGVVFGYLADLQDRYDLSDTSIGIIAGSGFASALLIQVAVAPFIDRGFAGVAVVIAIAAAVLGSFGFVFAEQTWTLAASRALSGIGIGLFSIVARKALIGVDITGGAKKVGMLFSFGVAGFISGPAIGSALGTVTFELPFIVLGVTQLILGVPAVLLISRAPIAAAHVDYSQLGNLLRQPGIQAAIGGQVALWGFIGLFDATVDRYLTDIGLSGLQIAAGLLAVGVPLIALPPSAGALAERVGARRVFLPALIALVPAIWIYGYVTGLAIFIVIGVVEGVIEAYATMGTQVLVLEATGAERVAIGTAAIEAVGFGAGLVTALIGPVAYGALGQHWLFGLWAAGTAVPVLFALQRLQRAKSLTQMPPASAG